MNFKDNWNEMAKAYEDFTESEDSYSYSIEWPCIKEMLPNLNNKDILDLGCGTGRFTFLLEEKAPKSINGIDISEKMLEIAKEKAKTKKSKAEFIVGNISDIDKYKGHFDFIFSSTTFHYIRDIKKLFRSIYNVLNNNGICIISLIHPVYSANYPIDKNGEFPRDDQWPWIEYNENIENYLSTSYHHTFSDYLSAALEAGFSVEKVEEPMPPEEWKDKYKYRYEDFIQTPSFLIIKLKKC